jgi:ADP-ribosyl-[dinitrogen reductase] hydrolase
MPPGAFTARFPCPVLTGHGEMVGEGEWSRHTQMALVVAESLLSCGGIDGADLLARGISGSPLTRTIPAAIAAADAGPEVTVDAARRLCSLTCDDTHVIDACAALHLELADAITGRSDPTSSFSRALVDAIDEGSDTAERATIVGALAGARWGIGAIPARWASPLHGTMPDGRRSEYDIVSIRALAVALASLPPEDNVEEPAWPARGPHLVDPRGFWVADLNGAARSHETVPGAHVISLSRVGDAPQQPFWRRFYLVDSEDPDDNIALDDVIDDVMTTVTACIDAGEPVVVHCFAGESRTGLVLRAWLMQRDGLTEADATARASELWPHLKTWNSAFTEALRRREGSSTVR